MLMPEIDLGYEVTHITLNTDGSSLLLAGSHNINVLYVHERVSEDGDTIICRYISSLQLHLMFIMHSCSYISWTFWDFSSYEYVSCNKNQNQWNDLLFLLHGIIHAHRKQSSKYSPHCGIERASTELSFGLQFRLMIPVGCSYLFLLLMVLFPASLYSNVFSPYIWLQDCTCCFSHLTSQQRWHRSDADILAPF
jgi:hypothetical protein